jgi:hypothetical protein
MRKKQCAPAPSGWYSAIPVVAGEYFRCGCCDTPSLTVARPGELCLLCRLAQQRAARAQRQDDPFPA